MRFSETMDFSQEGDFQESLLKKIKTECFSELSDEDLDYVNAAGTAGILTAILVPSLEMD